MLRARNPCHSAAITTHLDTLMQYIENKTFDEIAIGDSADLTRTLTAADVNLFTTMSGNVNPDHIDTGLATGETFHQIISHGMWGGTLISTVLGSELPGPGTVFLNQSFDFHGAVGVGDTVTVTVTVTAKDDATKSVTLDCKCTNGGDRLVISGTALVTAPVDKIRRPSATPEDAILRKAGAAFRELIAATAPLDPIRTAVVHPCDGNSLGGAFEARDQGLIEPILVGPEERIRTIAAVEGIDLTGTTIISTEHSHAAAAEAVALVRAGNAEALMKGALHTDEIMSAVVDRNTGLRTDRRMSHVFILDVPTYPKPLYITDAAINIAPDLKTKADIVQNAIGLAQAVGVPTPKVAVLSAVETILPNIPSTIEAAAICKMADRKQIIGGIVDGPLAFDNAISRAAAVAKGIDSPVAGDADILMAPDLESGNMMAKQLMYLAGADSAGLVLGARVPIMLTSRADGILSRVVSAALAQLMVRNT